MGVRSRISSLRSSGHNQMGAAAGGNFVLADKNEKVKEFPFFHHFKGSPTTFVLRYKNGAIHSLGLGLSFWFRQLNTSVAEVPTDDQELPFFFTSRSSDFQEVNVQGIISYRVADPEVISKRIDFTIELRSGKYLVDPKNKIESFLEQIAQEAATSYLTALPVDTLLHDGVVAARQIIENGFISKTQKLSDLGIMVVSISIAAIKPRADVEKAMQVPAFEALQEKSDQATFDRRAKAVEKEKQIQENELQNKIAIAKTQADLIAQEGANARKTAEEQAEAAMISATAQAERSTVAAVAGAEATKTAGEANAAAAKMILDVYSSASSKALNAASFRKLAESLMNLQSLSITPDLLNQIADHLEN